jgi:putative membrane protein
LTLGLRLWRENANMSDTPNSDPRVALGTKRTTLATFRTAQALDRTTLAWVRTTLTMGSFGFGMIGFLRTLKERAQTPEAVRLHHGAIRFGECLVLGGVVATVLAGISHWNTLRRIRRDQMPSAARWPLSLTVALFVALLGAAGLWSMFISR